MKKKKLRKRTSYLSLDELPLKKRPIVVWGYGRDKRFVCRLHINAAGVAAYSGSAGNKLLCDLSWERLVKKLTA